MAQGVRAALRVGRLTHSTVPHEANWLQWHCEYVLRVQVRSVYWEDEARKLLLHHLGTALASCLIATVLGLVQETHWGCGACGVVGY